MILHGSSPMLISIPGCIDGHGDPMAPIPGQRWLSDGPSTVTKKIRLKTSKLKIDISDEEHLNGGKMVFFHEEGEMRS